MASGSRDFSVIIKTDRLSKVYILGEIRVLALKEVTLSINKGIFLGVIGSSGSGKSTLLNLLGGLDSPTSGTASVQRNSDRRVHFLSHRLFVIILS